jgi:hypothetical protein
MSLLGLMLTACNRDYEPLPEHVNHVFPLQEGKHRIYHVVDTIYETATGPYDARTYYRKDLTDGTEQDLLDRKVYKLWRYTSPDTLNGGLDYQWSYLDLWTQYLDDYYAERIEGNRRRLVLRIPPYVGSTWNGNLYNNLDAQTYRYLSIDTTVVIRGTTFEHCVAVLQIPARKAGIKGSTYYREEHAYEIYAPYVGLILRHEKFYEEQNGTPVPESMVLHEELVSHNY